MILFLLSTQQLIEMRFDEIQDGDQDSEARSQLKVGTQC